MSGSNIGSTRAIATRRPQKGGSAGRGPGAVHDDLDQQLLMGNDAMKEMMSRQQQQQLAAQQPTDAQLQEERRGMGAGRSTSSAEDKRTQDGGPSLADIRQGTFLQPGTTGPAVVEVQRMLAKAGISVRESGVVDDATMKAVRRFQDGRVASVTGVVGPNTLAALEAAVKLGDIGQKMFIQALNFRGKSTEGGPQGGKMADAWAINELVFLVLGRRLGSNPNYVPSVETELRKVGSMVEVSQARPGDLVVASDQSHIGIYMGNGRVWSNNSADSTFSWDSNLHFDGAKGGGTPRIYRVNR
ncbi:peptidoglycan-binding protein [Myxococcota bacterium]|nr:peptidoglycan-binding protein [Myxococcota bacterium]